MSLDIFRGFVEYDCTMAGAWLIQIMGLRPYSEFIDLVDNIEIIDL
jgi:hypothetical protein